MSSKKSKKKSATKGKIKEYDYKDVLQENEAFHDLKYLIGKKNAIKLLSEISKDEVEYALDTEDLSRIILLPEYERYRMNRIMKEFSKRRKTNEKMYKAILDIKRLVKTQIDTEYCTEEGE